MSTTTEQAIQLPFDAAANKNLLRAVEVDLSTGSTLQQVIILADSAGNLVGTLAGSLSVADAAQRSLLADIRDRLDVLIDLAERKQ
jgi:hypothetical protein